MDQSPFTDGLTKKILYAGKCDVPDFKDGSKVIFHFQTQTIDKDGELKDIIDDSKKINRPMEIILGKQFKMPIWEECLKSMRTEEVAEFRVEKNLVDAYPLVSKSFREFAGISQNTKKGHCCGMMAYAEGVGHSDLDNLIRLPSDLAFTLELLKVELPGEYEKESWSMEPEEKLKSIPELKNIGNELYKNNQYEEAGKKYAEALGRLEQLLLREKPGDEEWVALDNLKIPILLNYAQCKLHQKDYYPVIEYTTQVLDKDKSNVKALYRRAKAYVGTWDLEPAQEDFSKVSELDPSFEKIVQKELKNIKALQKQKDDEMKSKLLGKV
ncbi:AH receptor-interacting protein isoform X2 [Parasteatoda tepidariorum]|uniref:AH receptor-interacting protein isoform X2 n=1 Tax=Parasteatoda tepidariorum TaxID=114398 RepID=UPI00077FD513|nr:AH receptor-interacting protein isoform X2 [Parasteatoda tepidariorum]